LTGRKEKIKERRRKGNDYIGIENEYSFLNTDAFRVSSDAQKM
jgi:hypothetical protein